MALPVKRNVCHLSGMAREDLHFRLRIPDSLKAQVEQSAQENRRSMTAEIIARLEASFDAPSREEFELTKKWAQEFLREALDSAVEQIVAETGLSKAKDNTLFQRLAKLSGEDSSPVEAKAKKG